jgi:foldase protein PrsA
MEMPDEGDVVATVNGEDITVSQLQAYMRLRMEGLASQYYIDWEQADVDALVSEVQAEVLEQLIEMKLISQGAAEAGIVADEAELAGVVHEVQSSIVDSQEYADWQDYLDTMDLSNDVVEDILRQSLLVNQMVLAQEVPAEAEQVHARHILVTDEALAADLLAQLAEGADFAELATANSEDTGSAQSGGDLGWFPRGIMVTEFDEAAFALEVGELSDAVPTTYGYHIIEVLEKETRELTPVHTQQLQQIAFIDWLQATRMESEIEWYVLEAVG